MAIFDRAKYKALVLYIIWRSSHVSAFGQTKLNKALWFAEARVYEAFGHAMTGEAFVRDKFGPRSKHLSEICAELLSEGVVERHIEPVGEFEAVRYRALSPADTSMFSADELALVDWWVKTIAEKHTATSISELSHDYGWEVAAMGEGLPVYSFLARRIRDPKTGEELSWAHSEAQRLGLT